MVIENNKKKKNNNAKREREREREWYSVKKVTATDGEIISAGMHTWGEQSAKPNFCQLN